MSFISVFLGELIHKLDEANPFQTDLPLDDYAAVALLVFFGVSTILDAAEPKMEEEKEDAVAAVGGMSPEGALVSTAPVLLCCHPQSASYQTACGGRTSFSLA
ncbi:hypothetical protein CYMTET_33058 [Cymbomonas tetramitiformis]|uniref:Uncharacterized protein n=1 Tax=Cymbomonas tetramitiformis TaxID=36881 RepID=A0AAE0KRL2_9CHLO|nr:hypothetical protein CYMTET_33058 [Cymbomonas tetramitiformis]